MWQIGKTDFQIYIAVNVGFHFVQHQPTIFSPTYETTLRLQKEPHDSDCRHLAGEK